MRIRECSKFVVSLYQGDSSSDREVCFFKLFNQHYGANTLFEHHLGYMETIGMRFEFCTTEEFII